MKRIILIFCMYSCIANAGYMCGPSIVWWSGTEKSFANNNAGIPVAIWVNGENCARNTTSITDISQLCTPVHVAGEAACVNQYWTAAGLDVNNANLSAGDACWCRRTHVRANDTLIASPGPWFLQEIYDTTSDCKSYCIDSCFSQVYGACYGKATSMNLLPE